MHQKQDITYGPIRTTDELGRLARAHRKQQKLTLETVSEFGNIGARFLSEFERGKKTAEIGKVLEALNMLGLDVVVQPRSWKTPSTNAATIRK